MDTITSSSITIWGFLLMIYLCGAAGSLIYMALIAQPDFKEGIGKIIIWPLPFALWITKCIIIAAKGAWCDFWEDIK